MRTSARITILGLTIIFTTGPVLALEKLEIASGVKDQAAYYLPVLAATEMNFWQKNGLEVEWVPFRTGAIMFGAMAGGKVKISLMPAVTTIQAQAGGVPAVIVADLYVKSEFFLWVKPDSTIKGPRDLKGKKLGIMRRGTIPYAYARVIAKAGGVEEEAQYIGTGDIPESVAAFKAGVVDAVVFTPYAMAVLENTGEAKRLISVADYTPQEWTEHVVIVYKDFLKAKPDTVKKVIKAIFQGVDFVRNNPGWAAGKMSSVQGFSEATARKLIESLIPGFSKDGLLSRKAIENLRKLILDYELAPKEKLPPVEQIYASGFAG